MGKCDELCGVRCEGDVGDVRGGMECVRDYVIGWLSDNVCEVER